jgi:hypothetical protein
MDTTGDGSWDHHRHRPDIDQTRPDPRPTLTEPGTEPAGRLLVIAALHVEGQRAVDLLGVREVQVGHDLHELLLRLGEAQVELLLLADAGLRAAFVVVRGEHGAGVGQSEELGLHHVVQTLGVAGLEVGAAAAADEEGVAREDHGVVVQHEAEAALEREGKMSEEWSGVKSGEEGGGRGTHVSVSRGSQAGHAAGAEDQLVSLVEQNLGARPGGSRDGGLHGGEVGLQGGGAGHVVGVAVRVDGVLELEPHLLDVAGVAVGGLNDGVDEAVWGGR